MSLDDVRFDDGSYILPNKTSKSKFLYSFRTIAHIEGKHANKNASQWNGLETGETYSLAESIWPLWHKNYHNISAD